MINGIFSEIWEIENQICHHYKSNVTLLTVPGMCSIAAFV